MPLAPPQPGQPLRIGQPPHPLGPAELRSIAEQWVRYWGPTPPQYRNRLLARRMKEAVKDDPWALDMAKQDGKDYM